MSADSVVMEISKANFHSLSMNKIFSFGEILWDQFPTYRIAGGSPFNVAAHLRYLGNESELISAVGQDEPGRELQLLVEKTGLSSHYLGVNELPTGTVTIRLTENGEPSYTIEEDVAWDFIGIHQALLDDITKARAFVFASLAQRSEMNVYTLEKLLEHLPADATVIFDCNLRPPFIDDEKLKRSIEWSDIVKCNEGEWEFLQELFDLSPQELVQEFGLEALLLTKGEQGASVVTKDGKEFHQPAGMIPYSDQKGDFVGVGDAFLASVSSLFLYNMEWPLIMERATRYAAWVASQQGGTPKPPDVMIRAVQAPVG